MSWKDVVKNEPKRCGYCRKLILNERDIHNSRFMKEPICEECNWDIELPRRMGLMANKETQGTKRWQEKNR